MKKIPANLAILAVTAFPIAAQQRDRLGLVVVAARQAVPLVARQVARQAQAQAQQQVLVLRQALSAWQRQQLQ